MSIEGDIDEKLSSLFLSLPENMDSYFGEFRLQMVNGNNIDLLADIHRKLVRNGVVWRYLRYLGDI